MADTNFDLIVVGGGPGGYVAAIRAAQLGMKTAVVEREQLGGICLNWGCIPTKALLRSAEVYDNLRHAQSFGLSATVVGFDAAAVVARSRKVAQRLNSGVAYLMKKNKVAVIWGAAPVLRGRCPQRARATGVRSVCARVAAGPGFLHVATRAEILVEQQVVAVDIGLVRARQLLALTRRFHFGLRALGVKAVQLLADRAAALSGRQRHGPRIAVLSLPGAAGKGHGRHHGQGPKPSQHGAGQRMPPSLTASLPREHMRALRNTARQCFQPSGATV